MNTKTLYPLWAVLAFLIGHFVDSFLFDNILNDYYNNLGLQETNVDLLSKLLIFIVIPTIMGGIVEAGFYYILKTIGFIK